MTDDRDRPMTQHLPPPSPDDPSAGQSSRTDAPALRDADALEAWLDARASSSHAGAAATPATDRAGQNGQSLWLSSRSATATTMATTTDAASLTGAASRFHARVAAAEEAEAPPAPVDAIWEQIMATSVLTPIPGVAAPTAHAHSPARAERPERHPFLRTAGSHPAATAVLVAAVILATILVFRAFDHNTPPPIIDQGPAALIPDGSATPSISPVASDVWLQPITSTECTQPGTSSDPHEQAAYLLRQFWACNSGERPLTLYSDDFLTRHPELRTGQFTLSQEDVTRAQAIAPAIAAADPQLTIPDLPAVANNWLPAVFLPRNAIPLDDGRFALPMTYAPPVGSPTPAATNQQTSVLLYVFTMQDGHPHIDDILASCLGDCDAIWAQQELQIGTPKPSDSAIATRATQQAATAEARIASPVSSPEASPSAIQLSTPDANGCIIRTLSPAEEAAIANPAAMPTPDYATTGPLDDEATAGDAATALNGLYGCSISQPPLTENQVSGAVSLESLATSRLGWTPNTRIPLSEHRLETAKALSSQLVEQDPTRYVVDSTDPAVAPWLIPHALGKSDGALLPQDFVTFADGRIGAPVKLARPGGAGTATKDSYMSPQTVTYVFFREESGVWLVDDQLSLCT
ncbi:MAG TPA: hypothetical protein VNP95_03035, partial [Thermomicrobiales bacterium]|nr:hypothetical protein [Thermomicrobiales bacterium]